MEGTLADSDSVYSAHEDWRTCMISKVFCEKALQVGNLKRLIF